VAGRQKTGRVVGLWVRQDFSDLTFLVLFVSRQKERIVDVEERVNSLIKSQQCSLGRSYFGEIWQARSYFFNLDLPLIILGDFQPIHQDHYIKPS
jgi:hypothetical protein